MSIGDLRIGYSRTPLASVNIRFLQFQTGSPTQALRELKKIDGTWYTAEEGSLFLVTVEVAVLMRCIDAFLASIATWLLLLRVIWAQSPSSAPTVIFKVYTAAGDGTTSYSGDGTSAINAGIKGPLGIVIDSSGNVYASDQNNRIRKITTTTGIISTYVGTGTAGYDNGAATSATVNSPYGLGIDNSDNIYIADAGNNRIRNVTTSTNIITTVAGTGSTGTTLQVAATDGSAATSALLYYPQGVALDTSGSPKNTSFFLYYSC